MLVTFTYNVNPINIGRRKPPVLTKTSRAVNPNLLKSLWGVALAIGLTLAGTALIEANKETTTSSERAPMPVAAVIYAQQPNFTRDANYLGVVRAGSDSVVGFEVAGVLTSLPATEGMRVAPGDVLAQLGTDRRQARLNAATATLERVTAEIVVLRAGFGAWGFCFRF